MATLVTRSGRSLVLALFIAAFMTLPAAVSAGPITLAANAVIIDNAPFYGVGSEDSLGSGNFALNRPEFIDIPYAIFDFGSTSAVTSATLGWNFLSLFGGSGPAWIRLYVGSDADGVISVSDRFMGTAIDTFLYYGGENRAFDVTDYVNAALASGPYFAVRLEAQMPPWTLTDYYGGQFAVPGLVASSEEAAVPDAGSSLLLLGMGLVGLRAWKKRLG